MADIKYQLVVNKMTDSPAEQFGYQGDAFKQCLLVDLTEDEFKAVKRAVIEVIK